jgi:hypothetical protein
LQWKDWFLRTPTRHLGSMEKWCISYERNTLP